LRRSSVAITAMFQVPKALFQVPTEIVPRRLDFDRQQRGTWNHHRGVVLCQTVENWRKRIVENWRKQIAEQQHDKPVSEILCTLPSAALRHCMTPAGRELFRKKVARYIKLAVRPERDKTVNDDGDNDDGDDDESFNENYLTSNDESDSDGESSEFSVYSDGNSDSSSGSSGSDVDSNDGAPTKPVLRQKVAVLLGAESQPNEYECWIAEVAEQQGTKYVVDLTLPGEDPHQMFISQAEFEAARNRYAQLKALKLLNAATDHPEQPEASDTDSDQDLPEYKPPIDETVFSDDEDDEFSQLLKMELPYDENAVDLSRQTNHKGPLCALSDDNFDAENKCNQVYSQTHPEHDPNMCRLELPKEAPSQQLKWIKPAKGGFYNPSDAMREFDPKRKGEHRVTYSSNTFFLVAGPRGHNPEGARSIKPVERLTFSNTTLTHNHPAKYDQIGDEYDSEDDTTKYHLIAGTIEEGTRGDGSIPEPKRQKLERTADDDEFIDDDGAANSEQDGKRLRRSPKALPTEILELEGNAFAHCSEQLPRAELTRAVQEIAQELQKATGDEQPELQRRLLLFQAQLQYVDQLALEQLPNDEADENAV
jgi:hypothetical protein